MHQFMANIQAENLVNLWMKNAIGAKEDFDVMVIEFLETLKDDISIYEVLNQARIKAIEMVSGHADNIPLQISYKAFNNSLEYQLQFWSDKTEAH